MPAAAKQFKDFNKDTKDLLTKQYTTPGDWKLESKIKPDDRTILLNPGFEYNSKGAKVSVDVDYNLKEHSLKTKTTFTPDGNVKPKVTWEKGAHKVEATLSGLNIDADVELTYEGAFDCGASVYDKVTKKAIEASVSYPIAALNLAVGGGIVFGFAKGLEKWNAGARYANKGIVANVTTSTLKTYTTGVVFPITVASYNFKFAGQVDCGGKFSAVAGFEVPVCCFTLKAKATNAGAVSLAVVRKFADKWTAAFSVTASDSFKVGVNLVRE